MLMRDQESRQDNFNVRQPAKVSVFACVAMLQLPSRPLPRDSGVPTCTLYLSCGWPAVGWDGDAWMELGWNVQSHLVAIAARC